MTRSITYSLAVALCAALIIMIVPMARAQVQAGATNAAILKVRSLQVAPVQKGLCLTIAGIKNKLSNQGYRQMNFSTSEGASVHHVHARRGDWEFYLVVDSCNGEILNSRKGKIE